MLAPLLAALLLTGCTTAPLDSLVHQVRQTRYALESATYNGEDVAQSVESKDWSKEPLWVVQQAAEQGVAHAQLDLGVRYRNGDGVPHDTMQTVAWYRKAAEQGYAKAQLYLGGMYDRGEGVPQDGQQAVAWYRKAAEQGHAPAQFCLGIMYDVGRWVPQDYRQAYAWYSVSVANGGDFSSSRDSMAISLNPTALAEAQALADRYFEQYQPRS